MNRLPIWKLPLLTMALLTLLISVSLSPAHAACLTPPPGLVSWWNFQSGGTDLIGSNSAYVEGFWDLGKAGYALGNDGAAARMQTTSIDFPVGNADRTMAMWVKLPDYQFHDALFAGYGAAGNGFEGQWYALGVFSYNNNVNPKRLFFSNHGETVIGPVLDPGIWYHVAVTNTGDMVKLYLDGAEVATGSLGLATAADSQFSVGSQLYGHIDELQVFDRALSAAEISTIFASDSSGLCYQLDITGTLGDGTSGMYYSQQLPMNSSYWYWAYTYNITSGSLPPGLSLAFGAIIGVPTSEGTYNFTAAVSDGLSGSGSASYTITINPAPPVSPQLAAATWHSIGPFTSEARALAIDPHNSQVLYAGTKIGIYKSTNGGASWNKSDSGITDLYVRAIVIDPVNSDVLYAGTDDGVYKSTDSGVSWTRLVTGIPYGEGIQSLAIDPNNSQVIYAGGSDSGIYMSGNGGGSWSLINNGTDLWNVKSIVVDPADSSTIYVSQPYFMGLYISRNGGASWTHSDAIPYGIIQVVIDPTNSLVVYAASLNNGIFMSIDGGNTWLPRSKGLENDLSIYSIAIHPTMPQILYAGSQINYYLYKSVDGGASWTINTTGKSNVRLIKLDSNNPAVLYVGYDDNGFIKTVNGGNSWAPVNNGMANSRISSLAIDPSNSQTVYVTTMTSLHKSTNGGQTWSASLHDGWGVLIDPDNANTLYLSNDFGVHKSYNGGTTWQLLAGSPTNGSLMIAPSDGLRLYYSNNNDGIYRSINGGSAWTLLPGTQGRYMAVVDPLDSKIIYASDLGFNLFKSSDGGGTWTSWTVSAVPLIIDPNDTQIMYGRSGGTVYKSTDGGLTWDPTGSGLPSLPVTSLAFDPDDSSIIYAGTDGNGVFVTLNGGDSWSQFNNGLPATSIVTHLAVDPNDSRVIFAGTEISGAYKTATSMTPIIEAPVVAYFNEGTAGSFQVTATGWPAPTMSVSGTMPDGLTFNAATGVVSGTPEIGTVNTDPYILMFTADNGQPPAAARAVAVYVLDTSSLTVNITAPARGASVELPITNISGTASSGETVEVQVTDGTLYLQSGGIFDTSPAWLPAGRSGGTWSLTPNANTAWIEGVTYTVIARISVAGSAVKTAISTFRISPSVLKDATILSAAFVKSSIRVGDTATISGRLQAVDAMGLSGKSIELIVTPPATVDVPIPTPVTLTVTTSTAAAPLDNFTSGTLSIFSVPGIYLVEVRFKGDVDCQAATLSLPLAVVAHSGYAVIVVGKTTNNSLLTEHKATAQAVKNILINKRGFLSANVKSVISTISAAKTETDISVALSTIKTEYQKAPAPVYLVMIDHGSPDPDGGFVLGSQTLLPSELGTMLDSFESGIDAGVLAEHRRFLIVGTCYSGLFQSLSKPGRVIITSSDTTEQSLAGSVSYSGTTASLGGGDFFIDTMFSFLGRGDSFGDAFSQAANAVALRDPRTVPLGIHSGIMDTQAQHPLLDDNGDVVASYDLANSSDGQVASGLYLGEGVRVPANGNPTDITSVSVAPSTTLDTGITPATLTLQVNDSSRVDSAWVEIRTPNTTASSDGTGQVIPGNLDSMPLIFDGQQWVGAYDGFTTAGTYHVYYYTRDNLTGDMSPMAHSVVYKKKAINDAPGAFSLSSPADASEQTPPFVMSWGASIDPNNGDSLTYTLLVATDQNFNSVVYRQENLVLPITTLPDSALKNPAVSGSYYCQNGITYCWWKVQAVDSYGEVTDSDDKRSFTIVTTNALPVKITGKVLTTAGPAAPVGTTIDISSGGSLVARSYTTSSTGDYMAIFYLPGGAASGNVTVAAYGTGFSSVATPSFSVTSGSLYSNITPTVQITLYPLSISITGSGRVYQTPSGPDCGNKVSNPVCSTSATLGSSFSLIADANHWQYGFASWSGITCNGGNGNTLCDFTLTGTTTATATFTARNLVKLASGAETSSLQTALATAGTGTTVTAIAYDFQEPVTFNRTLVTDTVTLDGGWNDSSYSSQSNGNYTTIKGKLTIQNGTLKVKGPLAVK